MSEQKLNFNEQGLLVPDAAISADLDTIEKYFVANFPTSKTRQKLFENLVAFNHQLQNEVFPWYEQWINGSFVTMKEDPNDVDVVTLLDYQVYEARFYKLEKFFSFSLEEQGIDSYFVPVFPEDHELHRETVADLADWHRRFTRARSRDSKGYLTLTFGNYT